jgi:hypothetical protein
MTKNHFVSNIVLKQREEKENLVEEGLADMSIIIS